MIANVSWQQLMQQHISIAKTLLQYEYANHNTSRWIFTIFSCDVLQLNIHLRAPSEKYYV